MEREKKETGEGREKKKWGEKKGRGEKKKKWGRKKLGESSKRMSKKKKKNRTTKKLPSPQGGSNSRPLVYETSALPLSYRGNSAKNGS